MDNEDLYSVLQYLRYGSILLCVAVKYVTWSLVSHLKWGLQIDVNKPCKMFCSPSQ